MHQVNLKAKLRRKQGKEFCKKVRREGMIPGVIYGKGFENIMVKVDTKDLVKTLTTGAGIRVIINLEVEDEQLIGTYTTMVTEIQKDVFQKKYLHADFHRISLDEKVHANIPIFLKGDAKGVKVGGGVLDQVLWKVPIEALPLDLPDKIEVDITNMAEDEHLNVSDLPLPKGAVCLIDPSEMVAVIHPPKVIEESAEEEAQEQLAGV